MQLCYHNITYERYCSQLQVAALQNKVVKLIYYFDSLFNGAT